MSGIYTSAPEEAFRRAEEVLSVLVDESAVAGNSGQDRLRRGFGPIVPEIELYLATDAVLLWARLDALFGRPVSAPFWASAWAGGQGIARYILDNPETVAGRRVLDLASGCGLAAIAVAMAGGEVVANDIDPLAVAAIELNAELNAVKVTSSLGDLLSGNGDLSATGDEADLVVVGDALYNTDVADAMLAFLRRVVARGGEVLIGDPGRGHLPLRGLAELATYHRADIGAEADSELSQVTVFRLLA
jgi:predicted nicotinamide N-methyase